MFQAIIVDRKNQKNNLQKVKIDEKVITSPENVTLLGLEVHSKLNFNEHISKLCNKNAGQLNALCRIGDLIGLEERKTLINSFIYTNFKYCPFAWHFSSRKSINKIENIRKRASRFLLNDHSSDYETLLKKANYGTSCMTHNRFSKFHCVYTIIQAAHTEFIKVVLIAYSAFKSSSKVIQEQPAAAVIIALISEKKKSRKKRKRKKSMCETVAKKKKKLRIL